MNWFVNFLLELLYLLTGDRYIPDPEQPLPPDEIPFWWDWWKRPQSEWPKYIGQIKVAYIQIAEDQPLRYIHSLNDADKPIFQISQIGGGSTANRRTIAKAGKWLMVYPKGDYYQLENDRVRPFEGNGGILGFHLMYEQVVDNRRLDQHPHRPLFWEVKSGFTIFEPEMEITYPSE